MTRTRRLILAGVTLSVLAGLCLLAVLFSASSARADSLPFTDDNATGSIGLCDAHGKPIRSGSMYSHAFVTAAASSTPAPAGYGSAQGGKATLYAFQPRKGVDPGEWSGFQLTGGSVYADPAHPLVSGTNLDPSLQDFLSAYPARWDGLVELRIYYTAPNRVVSRRTYPAAVLRVSNGTWTVLQGADLSCDLTKVVSSERLLLPASAFDPAHPAVTQAPLPSGVTAPAPVGITTGPAHLPASTTSGRPAAGSPSSPALAEAASTSHSTTGLWWSLAVLAVLAVIGGTFVLRHRGRALR